MTKMLRPAFALALAFTLAACATTPPPVVDLPTPAKKCVDVKTDLETGRNCRH